MPAVRFHRIKVTLLATRFVAPCQNAMNILPAHCLVDFHASGPSMRTAALVDFQLVVTKTACRLVGSEAMDFGAQTDHG